MPDHQPTNTPVKVTDVTLRDGHQSLFATRMRTGDMEPIAGELDRIGFHSMEVWGGATFDVAHRFLNEDPWERVRTLKRLMPITPLMMLLRGQNLVGYRNYPDDLVRAFVRQSAEVGIDIFRVFDALNDERNMESCFAAIKECGKHIQGTVCYSLTEGQMGGPIYNLDYYISKALALQEMGAHSLCIKDMSGLLGPYDAYDLVKALKTKVTLPIQLHTHYTSGMASMSILKAIEAGIDVVDTSLAPFALRSSHPSSETLVAALKGTSGEPKLDMSLASKASRHLESVFPKYRNYLDTTRISVIDTQVITHQIPGGMISNLVAQLREADALDRLEEVYEELEKVRADLGYPPLVTPTSQIVGAQAVQNVLLGRYTSISAQVKDYIYGLYGRPPAPVDPQLIKLALKDYSRGQQPIDCRPADLLEDELSKAEQDTKDISRGIEDVLTYALFPATGMRFLKWKYGLEEPPPEVRIKTLEEVEKEDERIKQAKEGKPVPPPPVAAVKAPRPRSFNVWVGGEHFQVDVGPMLDTPSVVGESAPMAISPAPTPSKSEATPPSPQSTKAAVVEEPTQDPVAEASSAKDGTPLVAPMPAIVTRYEVEEGQQITAGQAIVIIEAMKMENSLPSSVSGSVISLPCRPGQSVAKGDTLAVIG